MSAEYQADSFIGGTVHFGITTATTAHAEPGAALTTSCEVPIGIGVQPNPLPATLPIAAGALMLNGSTLFLSFTGEMDESSTVRRRRKSRQHRLHDAVSVLR